MSRKVPAQGGYKDATAPGYGDQGPAGGGKDAEQQEEAEAGDEPGSGAQD